MDFDREDILPECATAVQDRSGTTRPHEPRAAAAGWHASVGYSLVLLLRWAAISFFSSSGVS